MTKGNLAYMFQKKYMFHMLCLKNVAVMRDRRMFMYVYG